MGHPGRAVQERVQTFGAAVTSAVALIKEAIAEAGKGSRFLFPNDDGDGPLEVNAIAKTIRLANQPDDERPLGRFGVEHWTAHDLRRTAVSNMANLVSRQSCSAM